MPSIYDMSLPIVSGGLVYPGNPEIAIAPQQSLAHGAGANVSSLSFGSHTGTHVDAPKHFFDDGVDGRRARTRRAHGTGGAHQRRRRRAWRLARRSSGRTSSRDIRAC